MRRSPRIAIVDDDSEMRPVLARILRTAGFDPLLFASGDSASLHRLLAARGRSPDDSTGH